MLAPLSWLKDYVDITLSTEKLAERLSEVGLGVESIAKINDDTIFNLEITPNRSDLLSIVGIAREIATIEKKKIKLTIQELPKPTKKLPLAVHNDFSLLEHYASVVISNVTVKESPEWLKKRLVLLNLRPINNIVDITNYVMFELGIPLHAFDYDEIHGAQFFIEKSKGGEKFTSVDQLTYTLPKDAIIIRDEDRIVDLVGIKGGLNSGITKKTKNVLLQTSVDNPVLIRRASQNLALRSDASNILERGIDKNGLLSALNRAGNLILELAGGEIASQVHQLKQRDFSPWKLSVRLDRLHKILGIEIAEKQILDILHYLNLSPRKKAKDSIETTIPTYRNDLKIEEDLIEEVARLYGYNNFPKTMLRGQVPTNKIPYGKDYFLEERIKNFLRSCDFSEVYTYSLLSEQDLIDIDVNPQKTLRVDNPVSREFEYLRSTLKSSLVKALNLNKPNFRTINLFELGKVYMGASIDKAKEAYCISGISNTKSFLEAKGILQQLFIDLGIAKDPTEYITLVDAGVFFELNFSEIFENITLAKKFVPILKYPSITEDIALLVPDHVKIGRIIDAIKKQNPLIVKVDLLDVYEETKTFHIVYQHSNRNLTNEEVAKIRSKILRSLKEKFGAKLKE